MNILGGRHTCPGNVHVRSDANHPLVGGHDQKAAVAIGLVGHRVALEHRHRTGLAHVAAVHGHGIHELESETLEAHAVILHIGLGQQKRRALEGLQNQRHMAEQRVHDGLGRRLAIHHLHFQLVDGLLAHDLSQRLHATTPRLDQREVEAQKAIQALPGAAMEDADMRHGVHGSAREVAAQLLFLSQREANPHIGQVHQVGLRATALEVAALALDEQLGPAEATGGADLEDIFRLCDDDPHIVGIAEGCPVFLRCRSCGDSRDGCDNTVGDILGLDLVGKDLAFKFGLRVARDVVGKSRQARALGLHLPLLKGWILFIRFLPLSSAPHHLHPSSCAGPSKKRPSSPSQSCRHRSAHRMTPTHQSRSW